MKTVVPRMQSRVFWKWNGCSTFHAWATRATTCTAMSTVDAPTHNAPATAVRPGQERHSRVSWGTSTFSHLNFLVHFLFLLLSGGERGSNTVHPVVSVDGGASKARQTFGGSGRGVSWPKFQRNQGVETVDGGAS